MIYSTFSLCLTQVWLIPGRSYAEDSRKVKLEINGWSEAMECSVGQHPVGVPKHRAECDRNSRGCHPYRGLTLFRRHSPLLEEWSPLFKNTAEFVEEIKLASIPVGPGFLVE